MTKQRQTWIAIAVAAAIGGVSLSATVVAHEPDTECGTSAGGSEYALPWTGTDAVVYVVLYRGIRGEPDFTVILYAESNGMSELQRYDSLCDTTFGGTIEPDKLLFEGRVGDVV